MMMRGKIRDRMDLVAAAPTSALWILVLAIVGGTVVMSLETGSVAWDGVLAAAAVVGVIWILARVRGWHFWPW